MREEYYEWLSQLLFLVFGNMRYQMMVIICIINERRVLWMTESVTVSSLWQYEIPEDGDYLYYKWENGIVNVSTSLCNMRHQMMVIIYLMEQWYYEWLSLWIVDNFALLL